MYTYDTTTCLRQVFIGKDLDRKELAPQRVRALSQPAVQ